MTSEAGMQRSDAEYARVFLLEDYRHFSEALWKNEQLGETRFNWLVGCFTASLAAMAALATAEHGPTGEALRWVTMGALMPSLLLGVGTLSRLLKRNTETTLCRDALDRIRAHCLSLGPTPSYFQPTGQRRFGGLADQVILLNAFGVAALVCVASSPIPHGYLHWSWGWLYVCFPCAFTLAFLVQHRWVKAWSIERVSPQPPPEHSAVCGT